MINNIHDIFFNYPKVKVHEIAEVISISTERVVNILHTHLCMSKSSVQDGCGDCLQSICVDGSWIHHCTPESREGSKQWVKPG